MDFIDYVQLWISGRLSDYQMQLMAEQMWHEWEESKKSCVTCYPGKPKKRPPKCDLALHINQRSQRIYFWRKEHRKWKIL